VIVMVLASNGYVNPASRSALEAWINRFQVPFTTVIDAPGMGTATNRAWGDRDTAMVVDLATMRVLRREVAWDGERSAAARAIPVLLERLRR
jgi:hypothetical protein